VTTIAMRGQLPALYTRRDNGFWQAFLDLVLDPILNVLVAGGVDSLGTDWTAVAIDRMRQLHDPITLERRLLPYLAHHLGWDLDTTAPEVLQRKVLTLAAALLKQKGTKEGIVSALRLLLGLEVTYTDLMADGWELGRDVLDSTTVLAPAATVPGYARGELTGVAAAGIADHDRLSSAGLVHSYEAQRTAPAGGAVAIGFMRCVERARLINNLPFFVHAGPTVRFEFEVDSSYVPTPGAAPVDVRTAVTDADVATLLASAINGQNFLGTVPFTAVASGPIVALLGSAPGGGGNITIDGVAAELLDVLGMVGGAAPGAFVGTGGGAIPINLIGAVSDVDVATRVAYTLAFNEVAPVPGIDVQRVGADIMLRNMQIGAAGDGAFTGAMATKLAATGMMGGAASPNPLLLTFVITFPRHLSDDELRAATAVIEAMKNLPTHYRLINPPAMAPLPRWQLGVTRLNASTLGGAHTAGAPLLTGSYLADPGARFLGGTLLVPLGATPARSLQLALGGHYEVTADDDCYIRQGNRFVSATTGDAFLPATARRDTTPTTRANAFLSALRATASVFPAYLRIRRIDA
jgi:phage tail-like protein